MAKTKLPPNPDQITVASDAPASVAIALEHIHQQRAVHVPSKALGFIDNHRFEFRPEETGVINPWMQITDPQTGASEDVQVMDSAYRSFRSSDPKQRFAALKSIVEVSMVRGIESGASQAETEMMFELRRLLEEIGQGNYTDATLPPKCGAGKSSTSAEAHASLVSLVEFKRKGDGCSRLRAASRVLWDLDTALKPRQIAVADWLQGDGKTVIDQEDERIHRHAPGVVRWIEDRRIPTQELEAFQSTRTTIEETIAEAEQAPRSGPLYETLLNLAAFHIARDIKQKD